MIIDLKQAVLNGDSSAQTLLKTRHVFVVLSCVVLKSNKKCLNCKLWP